MQQRTMRRIITLLLCIISTNIFAWEAKVTELWVKNGEVRFVLEKCNSKHFKIAANDPDMPLAYDLLLSALLSHNKVKVYKTNLDEFTACPIANTMAGSVRLQP